MGGLKMLIRVDVNSIIRRTEPRVIGLNTNFLTDHANIRQIGAGYESALRRMGVKSLRYPGGEKSDQYFWSTPPWNAPLPNLSVVGPQGYLSAFAEYVENYTVFKHKPLDFDEFMNLCRKLGAEPILCVCFDSMYQPSIPGKITTPTKAQLLENAVEWVRYANVKKGYVVKYWELGNESYWWGSIGKARAVDYARDFKEFARAMKTVDPTIRIGANGHISKDARSVVELEDGPIWWKTLLEQAAADIDFLAVHPYPCWAWGSYDYYIKHNDNFTEAVDQAWEALKAWAPGPEAERIRIFATETNSADWTAADDYPGVKGWPLVNDLGHALVLFEILGQHLLHPKVDMAEVWNTRWTSPAENQLWNTLNEKNELNATGKAIAIWGQNLEAEMVSITNTDLLRTFASYSTASKKLKVFITNKDKQPHAVDLELQNYPFAWQVVVSALRGHGSDDPTPVYETLRQFSGDGNRLNLDLEPVSVSVLSFEPGI
jgi:alpha-L-arabinofuranosidase